MPPSINIACGFLDGTIIAVEGGYQVLQHPHPERLFNRIADARWFLAISWCDACPTPAGILNHEGCLSFLNQAAIAVGETIFLPLDQRQALFDACVAQETGKAALYTIRQPDVGYEHQVQAQNIKIDPRYGSVAIVQAVETDALNQLGRLAEL